MSENNSKATFAATVLMKRLIDRQHVKSRTRQNSSTLVPSSTKMQLAKKAQTPSTMRTNYPTR